ncbi:hypothetical protein GQ53DRAFT_604392, partial [Thozetella sp. PMI_491]
VAAVNRWREGWTSQSCRLLCKVAKSESLRLQIVTAQLIMKEEEASRKTVFSDYLPDQDRWDARMKIMARKGVEERHVAHWAWILSAPTGDSMIQRFLSTDIHKPIFVLFMLLDTRNRFRIQHGESLGVLIDYISKHYVLPRLDSLERRGRRPGPRSLDPALNMTADHFAHLLSKLIARALELWPAALVAIANLVASFIKTIPARTTTETGHVKDGQAARCLVLNRALELFQRLSRPSPMRLSKYNWEAQRLLLALANSLEPPLIISRPGYRAIRHVLVRLPKSPSEQRAAARYAKTWPPYRKNWDGVDERRAPEDDLSRSAKAGVFMVEAGYTEQGHDRALTALGGGQIDTPPTIQTRAPPPVLWSGFQASLNVLSAWAAEVRATRNSQEAWRVFRAPPAPDILPDIRLYAAMFEKLLAREVNSPSALPGDTTREAFAPHDVNLSTFEKARLQPPTIEELYRHMRHAGIRPVGPCLALLLLNANSIEIAAQYLQDSPFSHSTAALLDPNPTRLSTERLARELPLNIFNAWISLLCRLEEEGYEDELDGSTEKAEREYYVLHALALCRMMPPHRASRLPWHSVLGALAGPKFISLRRTNRLANFLQAFHCARESIGTDPVLLEYLGLFLQRYLNFVTNAQMRADGRTRRDVTRLNAAHQRLVSVFYEITRPVSKSNHSGFPSYYHDIRSVHIYRYMRALIAFGDADEMVRLMRWVLGAWERNGLLEEAKDMRNPDYGHMAAVFFYFNSAGERLVRPEVMQAVRDEAQRLVDEKGCTWTWSQPGFVDEHGLPLDITITESRLLLSDVEDNFTLEQSRKVTVDLPHCTLVTPRSWYSNYGSLGDAGKPVHEQAALSALMSLPRDGNNPALDQAFIEFDLSNFCIYLDSSSYPMEMRPLHNLATKAAHDTFYFDGSLSRGESRYFVRGVKFSMLPIGNYGPTHSTVAGEIWIQSALNAESGVYYRLKTPASEYVRFYEPFRWIADLTKHVVDYTEWMTDRKRQVGITNFKASFDQWLQKTHGLSPSFQRWHSQHRGRDFGNSLVSIGDVISTCRDSEMTGTKWKKESSVGAVDDDRWFGLVQKVHVSKQGHRSFDVIWLYRPADTPCGRMKYPWPSELFLSDHCSCEEGREARINDDEVVGVPLVRWFGSPGDCFSEFFVRQTYMVQQRRWVGLEESHMRCDHHGPAARLRAGETILGALSSKQVKAEPYEVLKTFKQGEVEFARLKQLPRRQVWDSSARPNELVYPEDDEYVVVKKIKDVAVLGACLVRFFRPEEPLPAPYDRNGTGNAFFITHKLVPATETDHKKPTPYKNGEHFPTSLRQGFDPRQQPSSAAPKLRGLDLFCGSGNFGRGLEEGGAIEMRWANDVWDRAVHTYMANAPNPDTTQPFLGSIDDLLLMAMEGRYAAHVPRPGDVDFISAGSPCQGFSLLTVDKTTPRQRKNQSLVAAFAAAVDLYRPKYGILENVISIVQAGTKRSEDILSQLVCAIVGLGYQAQLTLGDAWSYGAPQSRSRVFLYFAAPGLRLPLSPTPSHSHPPDIKQRDLGRMSNGEPFVQRPFQATPFRFLSAGQATEDLPLIGDGKQDCCIAFPDHRISIGVTATLRQQIGVIPTHPFGMNFVSTWNDGHGAMTPAERALFPEHGKSRVGTASKGWGRIHPRRLFHTVATTCAPTDARLGRLLHWIEDRPATVMEARRAQGFLDQEVLLGPIAHKWKLVGNSVARPIALAFGLEFRRAW